MFTFIVRLAGSLLDASDKCEDRHPLHALALPTRRDPTPCLQLLHQTDPTYYKERS